MCRTIVIALTGTIMIFALGITAVADTSYNVNADMLAAEPAGANPDGVWSYGYRTKAEGVTSTNFSPFLQHSTLEHINPSGAGVSGWYHDKTSVVPFVVINTTGGDYDPGFLAGNTMLTDEMLLHPGDTSLTFAVLRWTAPQDGMVDVAATFRNIAFATTDVHVVHNGTSYFDTVTDATPYGGQFPALVEDLPVTTGDIIDFVVGPNGDDFGSDSTGFFGSVTYATVPEPSALMLISLIFFVPLAPIRRRKE